MRDQQRPDQVLDKRGQTNTMTEISARLTEVISMARKNCDSAPERADNWAILARMEAAAELHVSAIEHFQRALRLSNDAAIRLDLVHALLATNNLAEAITNLEQITEDMPSAPMPWFLLGAAYGQAGRITDSIRCSEMTLKLEPDNLDARFNVAQACMHLRRFKEAIPYLLAIANLKSDHFHAHNNLGIAYQETGDHAQARRYLTAALQLRPDAEATRFLLASLGAADAPASAPPGYVANLFDKYAEKFDQQLIEGLGYRTPELLVPLCFEQIPSNHANLEILDIGCGTGLCGPLLRPRARRLVGVDLSPNMITKARERGCYDDLEVAEIEAMLRRHMETFDLIVAADVFPYVGDIQDILNAARRSLRPGGLVAFSTEASDRGSGYELRDTNRYAHSAVYLSEAGKKAEFDEVAFRESVLRHNRGKPVKGYLFVLRAR